MSDSRASARRRNVVLAAVGDLSFSGEPGEAALREGPEFPFAALGLALAAADLRFGNMESVLVPGDFPASELSPRALASSDRVAPALRAAGFDVLNLAANHCLDCGVAGLQHTRQTLERLGIRTFGAGPNPRVARRPAVLERNGLRIGFLGYQEDCNYTHGHRGAGPAYLDEAAILRDLGALRRRADCVVLSLHADLEFMETPAVWRRDLARRLAKAGADLILCTHPHVPQGVERVGRSLIAYSLGNCLFDAHLNRYMKDNGPHTAHSFVLRAELTRRGVGDFDRVPFEIVQPPGQRPVPYRGAARRAALRELDRLDRQLADDAAVRGNWRRKCLQMLETYLRRCDGIDAGTFMERWSWVLFCVQENRAWTEELLAMARELFEAQAKADKPSLRYHRPSFAHESAQAAARSEATPPVRPTRRR